ncbi:hypothetical protein [Nguyenibacter sp. L1]|uniref:tetratricopeptide repeat protein n=1 Tax=Nguyenibacter sp. L1 TaxID=3049350 RepID=UPI002B4A5827|nr:hypothetical protein [Nguyenibacter sp. L1]WRH87199.1 tetratricopeptide repeat protein [Nguyenibacter sp. L1]
MCLRLPAACVLALSLGAGLCPSRAAAPPAGQKAPVMTPPAGKAGSGQVSPDRVSPGQVSPGQAVPGKAVPGQVDLALLVAELARANTRALAAELEVRIEQVRLRPLSPTTRLLLRRAQGHLAAGKPVDAVEDLDDALVLQPEVGILWRDRAQARLAARDLDGAIADLGSALQHDPNDGVAWQVLSVVEEQRGDWQAAYRAWQHAMALDPMIEGGHAHAERLRLRAFGQPT